MGRFSKNPRGRVSPALERNVIKFRSHQMVLALFHSEELRKAIISRIRSTDKMSLAMGKEARLDPNAKHYFKKALKLLTADGVFNNEEKKEITSLTNFRNFIAHEIHVLTADLSYDGYAKSYAEHLKERGIEHDYKAVERLQHYRKILDERTRSHYISEITMGSLIFEATERALNSELKKLNHKIERLMVQRRAENVELNKELSLINTEFADELTPGHPYNRYESGQLTQRGAEVCYRLYDCGKSPMAVAHLMRISLQSAKARQKKWNDLGGNQRKRQEVQSMRIRKFYATYE